VFIVSDVGAKLELSVVNICRTLRQEFLCCLNLSLIFRLGYVIDVTLLSLLAVLVHEMLVLF